MIIDPEKLQSVNFCRSRELAAAICGVSVRAVDKIKKECIKGEVSSSSLSALYSNCDDFDKSVIKQIVSSFYRDGEYPSTAKILSTAKERIDGFQCSISSLRKILIELEYKYTQAPDGRKQLMERNDIVCARLQFLRKLKTLRDSEDTRPRIYLDETWVNQNHSRKRIWLDKDGQGGINTKTGKGGRLIVCHAGCAKYGFIPEARWVFRAVKFQNADYHSEMNAEGFTDWFTKLLQSLGEPSVIIMDNAPYHS